MGFQAYYRKQMSPVVVEETAPGGLTELVDIFCEDFVQVTGVGPARSATLTEVAGKRAIVVAVCGHSDILQQLADAGELDLTKVEGRREVYGIFHVQSRVYQKELLVIAGSEKRGATYGMFRLSEAMGVSPWYFWADAVPQRRNAVVFGTEVLGVSKEPSVRYRGFFINDEQPCFGNWAREKFGSNQPGPALYRHIFELLLRLKGNYLWPAMWRSDFTLDHLENAALADRMGVIIGASHHEPCCRSGGEFQKLRHSHPEYGTAWSFLANPDGISRFWRDGLMRNRSFESLITIGMRGENDSYLMPADATLADNINVLKAAITEQKKLIAETFGENRHPNLLAIYKEVEDYYQGDDKTPGLKDWDVLADDICMLCDDNFGHVRTLPGEEERKHPGGFGMYYHFDYYGGPVSYLWINTSPLERIWEQMCLCYDHGVQAAWIVNVGDIKNQELPLSYFLDLAYDYDRYGSSRPNHFTEYRTEWLKGMGFAAELAEQAEKLLAGYTAINGLCRPEVLKPETYHPWAENEALTMLQRTEALQLTADELLAQLEKSPLEDCFFELVYYPLTASINILRMQLFAGRNHYLVSEGFLEGNRYADQVYYARVMDQVLMDEYHELKEGKWNHMQSVFHIGYPGWNDEQWSYPVTHHMQPVRGARLLARVEGRPGATGGNPWRRKMLTMRLDELRQPTAILHVANGGSEKLRYRMEWPEAGIAIRQIPNPYVDYSSEFVDCCTAAAYDEEKACYSLAGEMEEYGYFEVSLLQPAAGATAGSTGADALAAGATAGAGSFLLKIYGIGCEETCEVSSNGSAETRIDVEVTVTRTALPEGPDGAFWEYDGVISMGAAQFTGAQAAKGDDRQGHFAVIEGFGRAGAAVKAFPTTKGFETPEDAPSLTYTMLSEEGGEYTLTILTAPNNPVRYMGSLRLAIRTEAGSETGEWHILNTIPDSGYVPWLSDAWGRGVLTQMHSVQTTVTLAPGENRLQLAAIDPAVVVEKLILRRRDRAAAETYLGAPISYRKG